MSYNVSFANATSPAAVFETANTVSNGQYGLFILLIPMLVVFFYTLRRGEALGTPYVGKSFMLTGAVGFIVSLLLTSIQLLNFEMTLFTVAIIITGWIMSTLKV